MADDLHIIRRQVRQIADELLAAADLRTGQIMIVGCSTSEVLGARIGTQGSAEVADVILDSLLAALTASGVYLAVQCCEHLNRALVVERPVMDGYNLEQVTVIPVPKAGGALAARAMARFQDPVLVETIQAHCGLDIGSTLIGMHLKRVAVPVRLSQKTVGQAYVTAARTRPKLIGGARAVYELPAADKPAIT